MGIKFHRFKVGHNVASAFGDGATWLIGLGILLAAASLTIFSYVASSAIFLIGFIPLIALFYLATNVAEIHKIILFFSAVLAVMLAITAMPDFVSTNLERSGMGLYHGILSVYFTGVFLCQLKNANKTQK
ncbi:MAG: hypothetical protein ACSHW0_18610 [Thalassotalea sp.]